MPSPELTEVVRAPAPDRAVLLQRASVRVAHDDLGRRLPSAVTCAVPEVSAVDPIPSSPSRLVPQHQTVPILLDRAAAAAADGDVRRRRSRAFRPARVPARTSSPGCPWGRPADRTGRSPSTRASRWSRGRRCGRGPAPAFAKGAPMRTVCTGVELVVLALPMPSSPWLFAPQHQSVPSVLCAQLCWSPSASASIVHAPASRAARSRCCLPCPCCRSDPHRCVVTGASFGVAFVPSPSCPLRVLAPAANRTRPASARTWTRTRRRRSRRPSRPRRRRWAAACTRRRCCSKLCPSGVPEPELSARVASPSTTACRPSAPRSCASPWSRNLRHVGAERADLDGRVVVRGRAVPEDPGAPAPRRAVLLDGAGHGVAGEDRLHRRSRATTTCTGEGWHG